MTEQHMEMLRRRRDYLAKHIAKHPFTGRGFNYRQKELDAVTWALRTLTSFLKGRPVAPSPGRRLLSYITGRERKG